MPPSQNAIVQGLIPVSGVRVDSMINRCVRGVMISTLAVSLEGLSVWTAEAISVGSKVCFSMDEGAKVGVDSV